MLTGFLPALCSLRALSKNATEFCVFQVNLRSGGSVFFFVCLFVFFGHVTSPQSQMLYIAQLQQSVFLCLCVIWDGPDLNFPVTIPTSTCMRCQCSVCGFVARWGSITTCVENISSTFVTVDVSYILSLNKTRRYTALRSLQFAALSGIPLGVFALMQ